MYKVKYELVVSVIFPGPELFLVFFFCFYWSIIALQNCVRFCRTMK